MRRHKYDFEIIAVNDGSTDKTWEVIEAYANGHKEIIGINQMSNFGQSAAYQAGFDFARGEYIVIVSADLEIPLDNIDPVIHYLDDGYDFVNTNRVGRWGKERAVKSDMANKIIGRISGVDMQDRGSGMKGFKRVLVNNLKLYGEMHRFIPDYVSVYGARMIEWMIEFEVGFNDRDYGQSAYTGSKRTVKVLLDVFTLAFMLYFARKPFWAMPGRLFGFTGAIIAGGGGLIGLYLFVLKLMGQSIGRRPLFIAAVLMIIVGVQSMMMGMLGELILRIYFESSRKKPYTSRQIVR
jgi:dolichol-phosphate mannosyltransferase